jgi:DNA-binding transcriptional ArsR family regulator
MRLFLFSKLINKKTIFFIAQPKSCVYLQLISCANIKKMKRDIFQAIADPTRRAILVLISSTALTPNAIAEQFQTTRQAVSKHIKILNECDLLEEKKLGREIYYQLKIDKMKEIDHWLEQFKKIWEQRFDQLDQVLMNLKSKENEI